MRQPVLFVALLLVLTATAAAQQKQPATSDKEKAEQRKVIIRDLLDTCAKCRDYDDA